MKRAILIVALSLTACGETKDQDIAACTNEARSVYRQESVYQDMYIGSYARTCMQAKGWRYKTPPTNATEPCLPLNPACYGGSDPLSKILDK
jgi:hypothetical protein